MPGPVILCADGSDRSEQALRAGLDLLGRPEDVVVVTVVDLLDPLVAPENGRSGLIPRRTDLEDELDIQAQVAEWILEDAVEVLGVPDAERCLRQGSPGPVICDLAAERGARAVVLASRGRSGLRRAVLGSVSDHVVRHAPCPVVISGPAEAAEDEGA